ncbi:MAG: hypothetical protein ACJAYG_000852 [Oceanicoccus sp.]|jgi:hypothetical protein
MIKKNLGYIDRAIRLLLAALILMWLWGQGTVGILELLVGICGLFLVLNVIFGRCYLWQLLRLSTKPK